MYVFHSFFYLKLTHVSLVIYLFEFGEQDLELFFCQQVDRLEHGDVGHGAEHVIFGEVEVHLTVPAYGEFLYLLSHGDIFCPKFFHCVDVDLCSGGLEARCSVEWLP